MFVAGDMFCIDWAMAWMLDMWYLITGKNRGSCLFHCVQTNCGANPACRLVGAMGKWSDHEVVYSALSSAANEKDKLYLLCLIHLHLYLFHLGLLAE
jgi:hypothetical protein